MWSLTATATAHAMVYFATLRWGLSVVYALWSTSGLAPRLGTALGLGCYGGAMWRSWGAVVVAGVHGLTFTKNGPFTRKVTCLTVTV